MPPKKIGRKTNKKKGNKSSSSSSAGSSATTSTSDHANNNIGPTRALEGASPDMSGFERRTQILPYD